MDHIDSCHQHHHTLIKNGSNNLIDYLRSASLGNRQMAATSTYHPDLEELEEDYEVEIGECIFSNSNSNLLLKIGP